MYVLSTVLTFNSRSVIISLIDELDMINVQYKDEDGLQPSEPNKCKIEKTQNYAQNYYSMVYFCLSTLSQN